MRCITGPPVPLPASKTTRMRRGKWNCAETSATYGVTTSAVDSVPSPVARIAAVDHAADFLDGRAMNRGGAADGFEAVELGSDCGCR